MEQRSYILDNFTVDPLTGLPRRAALKARLSEAAHLARTRARSLSVLALDLDNFGQVNTRLFFSAGDQVLIEVARLIASEARQADLVFRDGGDQFTVILPDANQEEACREAERIRQALASAPIRVQRHGGTIETSVTVSIGIATLAAEDREAWELFLRARQAVHRAKDAGRNCVA
jgi:two-component system cell cycle response regulator